MTNALVWVRMPCTKIVVTSLVLANIMTKRLTPRILLSRLNRVPNPRNPLCRQNRASPENPNDIQQLQLYLSELDTYNEEVATLQDDYKAEIDAWQEEQEDYKDEIKTYQEDLTELEVKRATAIGAAESTIERYKDDFGWTFLDKEDRDGYLKTIFTTWIAQIVIILILFGATVYLQKRRDVV